MARLERTQKLSGLNEIRMLGSEGESTGDDGGKGVQGASATFCSAPTPPFKPFSGELTFQQGLKSTSQLVGIKVPDELVLETYSPIKKQLGALKITLSFVF